MTTENINLVSRATYAKMRGKAARTVGKLTQKGIIPLHDDKIYPEEADECLRNFLVEPWPLIPERSKEGYTPMIVGDAAAGLNVPGTRTYTEARTQEKEIRIEILKLELALKKGEMVPTKDVEFAAFTAARQIRDKMLNIPDRVGAILAAETDETKVRDILTEHIEGELSSMTEGKYKYIEDPEE